MSTATKARRSAADRCDLVTGVAPCFGCDSMTAPRSACPECGIVLCQPCAEAPDLRGYVSCCDVPPSLHVDTGSPKFLRNARAELAAVGIDVDAACARLQKTVDRETDRLKARLLLKDLIAARDKVLALDPVLNHIEWDIAIAGVQRAELAIREYLGLPVVQ